MKVEKFCLGVLVAVSGFMAANLARAGNDKADKPYGTIECNAARTQCKVDQKVYTGYQLFSENCLRCHGQGAEGSSFAPSLVDRLQTTVHNLDQFRQVVANGKSANIGGVLYVMPAWSWNKTVMANMDSLYAYLKARSDGALPNIAPEPKK